MAGRKIYEDSSSTMIVPLQNQKLPHSFELVESLMVHNHSSKPSLQGSKSMVNVVNVGDMGVINSPFFQTFEKEENNDDDDDHVENFEVCLNQPGKKRRLTNKQVHFLESSFEVENKLEPERKVQLAKELSLKPRQVAIWFQNRRARFKTKQLEKDYCSLKASYDILKVDYDSLFQENNKLKEEVNSLKNKLVPREEEEYNLVDKSLNDVRSQHKMHMDLILNVALENGSNSSKSDVVDSESPHKTDGNNSSSIMEPAYSSHVIEPNQTEFSQDEESNLLAVPFLTKTEDVDCYDEPHESSCCFQLPYEDQTFCFWSY